MGSRSSTFHLAKEARGPQSVTCHVIHSSIRPFIQQKLLSAKDKPDTLLDAEDTAEKRDNVAA